jgi:hypothetical protein
VQLPRDARFLGGSVNEAEFAVRIEKHLLPLRQVPGHEMFRVNA